MGDVISIIDSSKNTVVNYGYNAWGNVVDKSVNSNLENTDFATANPMLYRSYYRDDELGVYYLQSRYYKSDWCRFINADLPSIAKLCKNEQNGLNLFAYCGNEPITNIDYLDLNIVRLKQNNMLINGGTSVIIVIIGNMSLIAPILYHNVFMPEE